jgi:hypothetical protein
MSHSTTLEIFMLLRILEKYAFTLGKFQTYSSEFWESAVEGDSKRGISVWFEDFTCAVVTVICEVTVGLW